MNLLLPRRTTWRIVLGLICLCGLIAGCGKASASRTDATSTTTVTPTPTPTPTRTSTVSPTPTPNSGTVTARSSATTAPQARVSDDPQGAKGAPSQAMVSGEAGAPSLQYQTPEGQNYWATDWCHYYYSRGSWYGDECVRTAADANGAAIANLYNLYPYPGPGRPLGDAVQQISTDNPGYTTIRNLKDPTFGIVQWARWPANQSASKDNLEFMVIDSLTNQRVWMRATALVQLVASGNGPRYGFQTASNTFVIPDTSAWLSSNTTLGDLVAGMGGSLSNRTLQPNCTLPGVTCYWR